MITGKKNNRKKETSVGVIFWSPDEKSKKNDKKSTYLHLPLNTATSNKVQNQSKHNGQNRLKKKITNKRRIKKYKTKEETTITNTNFCERYT